MTPRFSRHGTSNGERFYPVAFGGAVRGNRFPGVCDVNIGLPLESPVGFPAVLGTHGFAVSRQWKCSWFLGVVPSEVSLFARIDRPNSVFPMGLPPAGQTTVQTRLNVRCMARGSWGDTAAVGW